MHLACILPPLADADPEFAQTVNVGGTQHVIDACLAQPKPLRLIHGSSGEVHGATRHLAPPRTIDEARIAVNHYSAHKIAGEELPVVVGGPAAQSPSILACAPLDQPSPKAACPPLSKLSAFQRVTVVVALNDAACPMRDRMRNVWIGSAIPGQHPRMRASRFSDNYCKRCA